MRLPRLCPSAALRPAFMLLLGGVFFFAFLTMLPPLPLGSEEFRFSAADGADKINKALGQAKPGDRILLKRGDTFTGPLVCKARGSKDSPISLGAWGEGADPVIADLSGISTWEPAGKNLWKTVLPRPKGQVKLVPALLLRGDTVLALGREPERTDPWDGYLVIGKGASRQSITPQGLDLTVDWTGAEVVLRTRRWILDRMTMRTVMDGRMIFREKLGADYTPYDTFGFFIQNHPACLDQEGEWCFNAGRREILLFSSSRPGEGEYRFTSLPTLLDLRESAWVEVENLDLRGSNETCVRVDDSVGLTMKNCRISLVGRNGLAGYDSSGFTLESCVVDRVQNNAVDIGQARDLRVLGNTISNTALLAGMGQGGDGQYDALQVTGTGILVENNLITNTGYLPIFFGGDHVMIRHNRIREYALTKDDCGGIYTWSDGKTVHQDRQVVENFIQGGRGSPGGQSWEGSATQGIYMDDRTDHVLIQGNVIQDVGDSGIFIHNAHELEIRNNTVFGCGVQILFVHDSIAPDHPIKNCLVTANVFSTSKPGQTLGAIHNTVDEVFPVLEFKANSWQSIFQAEGVFTLGHKDKSPSRLFLDEITGPGGLDPGGRISSWHLDTVVQSGEAGPDLVTDGSFALGTSRWSWWSNRDAGLVASSGSGIIRMSFPKPSDKEDSYLLFNSAPYPMEAGKYYRLTFTARSSLAGVPLSFLTRRNGEPWTQSSPDLVWRLGKDFQTFSVIFPSFVTEAKSRAEFVLRQSELLPRAQSSDPAWVELKSVEFRPVQVLATDPAPFFRLLSNPGPQALDLPAGPGWFDPWGNPAGASVDLGPWTAKLIFRQ